MAASSILVYGYGNPGRQDDGLGPALIAKLEEDPIQGVETDSNYQLNIEDAEAIHGHDAVIFVDASVSCGEPYEFYGIEPDSVISFTTHAMLPQSVMALYTDMYERKVEAYILSIRGYDWDYAEGLSPRAVANLEEALRFIREELRRMLNPEGISRAPVIN